MSRPRHPHPLLASLAGCACFAIAAVYFAEPAAALPAFFPGHVGSQHLAGGHSLIAYGIAALVVGLAVFAYAWTAAGPAAPDQPPP